jgi:hypothetical protein
MAELLFCGPCSVCASIVAAIWPQELIALNDLRFSSADLEGAVVNHACDGTMIAAVSLKAETLQPGKKCVLWAGRPYCRRQYGAHIGTSLPTSLPRAAAMRNTIFAFFVLVLSIAVSSPGQATDTASHMAGYCQTLVKDTKGSGEHLRIPNTKGALLCWGYMQAMQDVSVLVTPEGQTLIGSCPPEQTKLLQLTRIFIRYERSNPRMEEGNAAAAMIKALQDAFPCHQQRASMRGLQRQRHALR